MTSRMSGESFRSLSGSTIRARRLHVSRYTPWRFQPLTAERARGTRDKRIFSTGCAGESSFLVSS